MKVKDFVVKPVELSVVKDFIEKNHYSGSKEHLHIQNNAKSYEQIRKIAVDKPTLFVDNLWITCE